MIVKKTVIATILSLLFIACSVPAAEIESDAIPPIFKGYVSVSSPNRFFEDVDKAIAGAVKGRDVKYVPGMIPVMFKMFFPLPPDAWDADGEAFMLMQDLEPNAKNVIFVFSVPSFGQLVDGIKRKGFPVTPLAPGRVRMRPKGGKHSAFLLADLGGGRAIAMSNESQADEIIDAVRAWRPRHRDTGCASMYFRAQALLEENDFPKLPEAFDLPGIDALADELAADNRVSAEAGVAIPGLARLARRFFLRFQPTIEQMREFGTSLRLDADRVVVSYVTIPEPGTYLERMTTHVAGQIAPDTALAKAVGPEALGLALVAPPHSLFPEAEQLGRDMIMAVLDEIMPDGEDTALDLFQEAADTGVGETVFGGYQQGDAVALAAYVGTPDPKRLLDILIRVTRSGGAAACRLFTTPASLVTYAEGKGSEEGLDFHRMTLTLEVLDPADTGQPLPLLKKAVGRDGGTADLFAAAAGSCLVMTNGKRGPAWLAKAVGDASGTADCLAETPEARTALNELTRRQQGFLLLGVGNCAQAIIDRAQKGNELSGAAADSLRGIFRDDADVVAFGSGAEPGRMVSEMYVTTRTINKMLHANEIAKQQSKR